MKRETNFKVGDIVKCIYQDGGLDNLTTGDTSKWDKAYRKARDSGRRYVVDEVSHHRKGHQLLTFKDSPSPVEDAYWIGYFFELVPGCFSLSDVDD